MQSQFMYCHHSYNGSCVDQHCKLRHDRGELNFCTQNDCLTCKGDLKMPRLITGRYKDPVLEKLEKALDENWSEISLVKKQYAHFPQNRGLLNQLKSLVESRLKVIDTLNKLQIINDSQIPFFLKKLHENSISHVNETKSNNLIQSKTNFSSDLDNKIIVNSRNSDLNTNYEKKYDEVNKIEEIQLKAQNYLQYTSLYTANHKTQGTTAMNNRLAPYQPYPISKTNESHQNQSERIFENDVRRKGEPNESILIKPPSPTVQYLANKIAKQEQSSVSYHHIDPEPRSSYLLNDKMDNPFRNQVSNQRITLNPVDLPKSRPHLIQEKELLKNKMPTDNLAAKNNGDLSNQKKMIQSLTDQNSQRTDYTGFKNLEEQKYISNLNQSNSIIPRNLAEHHKPKSKLNPKIFNQGPFQIVPENTRPQTTPTISQLIHEQSNNQRTKNEENISPLIIRDQTSSNNLMLSKANSPANYEPSHNRFPYEHESPKILNPQFNSEPKTLKTTPNENIIKKEASTDSSKINLYITQDPSKDSKDIQAMSSNFPNDEEPPSRPQKNKIVCHEYQTQGICSKQLKCMFDHKNYNPDLEVCIEVDCRICEKKIFDLCWKQDNHDIKKCSNLSHLPRNVLVQIQKELVESWKSIIKLKTRLHDSKIDLEASKTDALNLKNLLIMRKIFSDEITYRAKKYSANKDESKKEKLIKKIQIEINHFRAALPAYLIKKSLRDELKSTKNPFCMIIGPTGSGKTTQSPQFLFQYLKGLNSKIICVQPRRVAAISLAARVAQELGFNLGEEVGYQVGSKLAKESTKLTDISDYKGDQLVSDKTKIFFVTEAFLLKKIQNAKRALESEKRKIKYFANIGAILLDEIHERSLNSDLIFGMMKTFFIQTFPGIKIFLASATVDKVFFKEYFNNCNILEIPGRTFPIDMIYKPLYENNHIEGCREILKEIISQIEAENQIYMGHVIVFLTAVEEMEDLKKKLVKDFANFSSEIAYVESFDLQNLEIDTEKKDENYYLDRYEILFLHGKLTNEEQQLVFSEREDSKGRKKIKIILSTKIAESSITVNNVKTVIDSGLDKDAFYDARKGITILKTDMINQSSANQRAGRAGRTSAGTCYRIYSEETFQNMKYGKTPEIARICLDHALLKIIDFGENPRTFPYFERPEENVLEGSIDMLKKIGALDIKGKVLELTEEGKLMMMVVTEPKKTKTMLEAYKNGVFEQVLKIIALEAHAFSLFAYEKVEKDGIKKKVFDREKKFSFESSSFKSDLLMYLNIYETWEKFDFSEAKTWASNSAINLNSLKKAKQTYFEIKNDFNSCIKHTTKIQSKENAKSNIEELVLKAFIPGNIYSISRYSGFPALGFVSGIEGYSCSIHPSSSCFKENPGKDFVRNKLVLMSTQIESTEKGNKCKHVSFINWDWVRECNSIVVNDLKKNLIDDFQFDYFDLELPSWAYQFFKKRYRAETDKLIQNFENKSEKISISARSDGNGMLIACKSKFKPFIVEFFENLKKKYIEKTKREIFSMNIPNSNLAVLIGDGFRIIEIIFPDEYNSIKFAKLPISALPNLSSNDIDNEFILRLFTIKSEWVQFLSISKKDDRSTSQKPDETISGTIRFRSKNYAKEFIEKNQLEKITQFKNLELQPVFESKSSSNMFQSNILKVTLALSNSKCEADLTFLNVDQANLAKTILNSILIDNIRVTSGNISKYNSIHIKGLSPYTDEVMIKEALQKVAKEVYSTKLVFKALKVLREVPQEAAILESRMILQSLASKDLTKKEIDDLILTVEKSDRKDQVIKITFPMPTRELAEKFIKENNANRDLAFKSIRVKLDSSITLKYFSRLYILKYPLICRLAERLKQSAELEIKFDDPTVKSANFLKIKILGENNKAGAREFENLMEGSEVKVQKGEEWRLFTKDMKTFYQNFQKENHKSIHISWDFKTKKVKLFTLSDIFRIQAEEKIKQAINNESIKYELRTIKLGGYSLKAISEVKIKYEGGDQQYSEGNRVPKMKNESTLGPLNMKIDYSKKEMTLEGTKNAIAIILSEIDKCKIIKHNASENDCPICFSELDRDYHILLYCGHKLCSECGTNFFKAELEKQQSEVFCPVGQTCKVAFKDLREFCSFKNMEMMIEKHIDQFVSDNKELYNYCGNQKCSSILRLGKDKTAKCMNCEETFCYGTNRVHKAHPGKSCKDVFSEDENSKYIQAMLNEGKLRISPCCKILFVKEQGCDHITCKCGKNWCYRCVTVKEPWRQDHLRTCDKNQKVTQIYQPCENKANNNMILNGKVRILLCHNIPFERVDGCNHMTCPTCTKPSCYQCATVFQTYQEYDRHQPVCQQKLPPDYLAKYQNFF